MTDDQARELLTHRLGAVRLGLEPGALDRIIAAAAGLPLALAIVSARIAIDPELGLAEVADELSGSHGDGRGSLLSGWSADERSDLASVFDWSYELLDVDAARVFRLLALHPGLETPLAAIASITGLDLPAARRVTTALVGVSLLERRGSGWFVMHDLLRGYAVSRLTAPEKSVAEARMVGHYVRSTRNAWGVFGRPPVGELDPVAVLPALQPETFETMPEAVDWYQRERTVLRSALHLAIARGWDRAAANIAIDWRPMNQTVDVDVYTYPHVLAALAAAKRTDDALLRAELHRDVGPKAERMGQANVGLTHLEQARTLYASLGDQAGEANVLRNLASLSTVPRDASLGYLRAAVDLLEGGEAAQVREVIRVSLATQLIDAGPDEYVTHEDRKEAERLLTSSISVLLEQGWTYLLPAAAATLAEALMGLSRPREALEAASNGLPFTESDPLSLALLYVWVADAALASGERAIAEQACRDFRSLVEAEGRGHVERMLATAALVHGEGDPFGRIEKIEASLARDK